MEPIYHLALGVEWRRAEASGLDYDRSTVGRSLAEEGFIHCSTRAQVEDTARRYYAGQDDVILLEIDPFAVAGLLVWEAVGEQVFPHLYGALPLAAVTSVAPFAPFPG